MGWRYDKLPAHLREAIDDQDARDRAAEPERIEPGTLERPAESPPGMVNLSGPLRVRIIRRYAKGERPYDDDNLSGGCKELRDAIAAMLGRRGDSAQDELAFEYEQRPSKSGQAETIIEIYRQ